MIWNDSEEKRNETKEREGQIYKLAYVDSVTSGIAVIHFFGEENPSEKTYKRLSSYTPAAGDKVLLMKVSGTYVILGKVV